MDRVDYVHGALVLPPRATARKGPWRIELEPWRRARRLGVLGHARRAFVWRNGRATLLRRGKDPVYVFVPNEGEDGLRAQSELTFFDTDFVTARKAKRQAELGEKRRRERREHEAGD